MTTLLLYCLFILLSIFGIAQVDGFSPQEIPSSYHVSKNNHIQLKGIVAISVSSQFGHNRIHRPLFGTAADSDMQEKKTRVTAKKKKSTNKHKNKHTKKHKQRKKSSTNNKYQKHNKYKRRKQKQRSKSTNISKQSYNGPTIDELKALTEYHLSQNINTNDCSTPPQQLLEEESLSSDEEDMSCSICSYGDMSRQQMDEFARLISSWYKLQSSNIKEMKSRQDKLLAAEMAEQCLRELIEERVVGKNTLANNNMITSDLYYNVIKSWLHVADNGKFGKRNYKDLLHATSLLDLMERTHDMNSEDDESRDEKFIASSIKCYATILDGWCKSKSPGSEAKAEEILHRMTSIGGGAVDVRYYNNVINRIATSGKNNAGIEAERLLNQLIDLYKKNPGEASAAPNRNSFNTVIKAYANSGDKDSSINVQRILNMMEHPESLGLPDSIAKQIIPDKISYTSILNAWAHNGSGDEDVGERAEELLQQMYDMYNKSSDDSDRRKDVKPDTVTYNAVLKVWGKCGHPNSGERSIALLDDMIQRYKDGDSNVIPDDVTYNSVINNIANSNSEDSPQHAIQLLEEMESSYESGLIKSKPDIISYNSVLNAFAKQGGYTSAKRAEEMLNKLEESYDTRSTNIRPDVISYNIVINAWGGYANKAVALLDRMRYHTNEGKAQLKPDITTYNSILNAWSQSPDRNAPVKALGLLEIMLRLHEQDGDTSAKPDVQSFTTVINAFSKSKFPRKARQTRDLLKRMKSLNDKGQLKMRPNVFVYAAVLNACAYTFGRSEEKEEALQVAIETYDELQASTEIETNHVAYGSFIRVCRRLISNESEREEYITNVFRQCCNDGQLGDYVLRQLRAVPSLYKSLFQEYIDEYGGEVVYQELPKRWTCNVKEGGRKKRVRV